MAGQPDSSAAWSSACSMLARTSAEKKAHHFWHCCGGLRWKPRGKKHVCFVTISSQKPQFLKPIKLSSKISWRRPSRRPNLLGYDRWAELFENFRTLSIFVQQKFARDLVQAFGQRGRKLLGIGTRILSINRSHCVDMLIDQFERDTGDIGRVLDQAAETVSGRCYRRISECGRFALDVMGCMKERIHI